MRLGKCLIWLIVILALCIIIASCTAQMKETPQPQLHPIAGKSVMFIPEGCKIGDIEAPEDGIYISESILLERMLRKQKEEQRRNQQSRT